MDKALRLLDRDLRHPGLRSQTVKEARKIWAAYVNAKYRRTFERQRDVFIMRNVDNPDECLKNP